MTTPIISAQGDSQSFFASQFENPTQNELIYYQVDPTSPQTVGLTLVSNPAAPSQNAQSYVSNFDPDLYNLADSSHLMRLIRAIVGASGLDGIRRQVLIATLSSMLAQGSFLDLDKFYGQIFGLPRRKIETMPINLDGTQFNPFTDLANSDIQDAALSADARYRARLYSLAKAINMGATWSGLKLAAEAVVGVECDLTESWAIADYYNNTVGMPTPTEWTYNLIQTELGSYAAMSNLTYADLYGNPTDQAQLDPRNRGEIIVTPRKSINQEEKYQLQLVLNKLRPAGTVITIGTFQTQNFSLITPRALYSDSEDWTIQQSVIPSSALINPATPIYQNAGDYSLARPMFSDYSGEKWSYNGTVTNTKSYRMDDYGNTLAASDDQTIVYSDGKNHRYSSTEGMMDVRQAVSHRLSGEGVVTTMPYSPLRNSK